MNFNYKKNFFLFFSTVFGIGMFPVFPGTISSVLSVIFYYFFFHLFSTFHLFIILFLSIVFGIYICEQSEKIFEIQDCNCIVLDEFIGMFFSMIYLKKKLSLLLLSIVLFRMLDIFKPWPIRYFDKNIKGGIGIMLDDIFAGFFTSLILIFLQFLYKDYTILFNFYYKFFPEN